MHFSAHDTTRRIPPICTKHEWHDSLHLLNCFSYTLKRVQLNEICGSKEQKGLKNC
jgi:hypothetical protein